MIKEIKIKKLFNQFDYNIRFNINGITIITGPNGFGKSTILKIIAAIEEKDLYEICKFSFQKLNIKLSNNKSLCIDKKGKNSVIVNGTKLIISTEEMFNNLENDRYLPLMENIYSILKSNINENMSIRNNIIHTHTYNRINELHSHPKISSFDRLIYANITMCKIEENEIQIDAYKKLNSFLISFKKDLGPIKFIKEQRLLQKKFENNDDYASNKREIAVEVINEIPKKIKDEIKTVVLKYSEVSSKLDSTFPNRLFNTKVGISQNDYILKMNEIIEKQEKIQSYKLLSDLKYSSTEYSDSYSQALSVYLQDTKQKLEVFDDLVKRLDLFTNIINSKLNFKKIVISNENGLDVIQNDDSKLPTSKLSSGEQQIIVLYYELIFGVKDKLTLLIDEPEISLHVAWQRELLKDFKQIVDMKNNELSIIVATHSPQVIDNNWDLVIDLGEQYE